MIKWLKDDAKKLSPVKFIEKLGPGLITGAADDDPSGIATYSITGAQTGTALLWCSWVTWPLMGAVQMMCARIAMVTGRGLSAALRKKLPKPILILFSGALLVANTINIGADLSGMADAAEILTGINSHILVFIFGLGISYATVVLRYGQIAHVLKWLTLALFSYVITAFIIGPDWLKVAKDTFIPSLPKTSEGWSTLVAILGTTISPYLFYWQASQEVEEEIALGYRRLKQRRGATKTQLSDRKIDVGVGTFLSNIVMFFIILTTALTLHAHGITDITSSKQAALALEPLAGHLAMLLFTIGILGVGFLAIPTLTGSAAYAFAETFHWSQGLDKPYRKARPFYAVIFISTAIGIAFDFLGVNPVSALFWSAVVNGLVAPFMMIGILLVATDKKIMIGQPSGKLCTITVIIATIAMFGAMVGMFVF